MIDQHLDQFRLLTTNLRIREPRYVGVKVLVEIVVAEYNQPAIVQARVINSLKNFISPLDYRSFYFLKCQGRKMVMLITWLKMEQVCGHLNQTRW
ncbi:MAG: hypothetical protein HGB14_07305 [Anaerolineaceae bacterium]|nr:hypothetical protein [Anaerolineaceae bacterium]